MKDDKWHKTILGFNDNELDYLPITDIAAFDIGGKNEEFGLEIGPVCFS